MFKWLPINFIYRFIMWQCNAHVGVFCFNTYSREYLHHMCKYLNTSRILPLIFVTSCVILYRGNILYGVKLTYSSPHQLMIYNKMLPIRVYLSVACHLAKIMRWWLHSLSKYWILVEVALLYLFKTYKTCGGSFITLKASKLCNIAIYIVMNVYDLKPHLFDIISL